MASQERTMPFIKNLAASDKKTRTSALTSLRAFLSARHTTASLSDLDILKLWKGLFYAVWMSDRPLPQQALCADLAALIHVFPPTADGPAIPWLRGFWATMAREWSSIDVLRLDKFLLLVRRVLGESLLWMKVREEEQEAGDRKRKANGEKKKKTTKKAAGKGAGPRWDAARADAIVDLLAQWPFVVEDEKRGEKEAQEREEAATAAGVAEAPSMFPQYVPVGLKLHVLDIWVDEAEKVGLLPDEEEGEEEDEQAKEIIRRITELVDTLERGTMSPAVRIRSKQSLLDDRLPWNGMGGGEDGDSD